MEALVRHLVEPIVSHADAVSLNLIEGEAVVALELRVHDDDRAAVEGEKGRTLRSIRAVLSAAAGKRKATLDLLGPEGGAGDEE